MKGPAGMSLEIQVLQYNDGSACGALSILCVMSYSGRFQMVAGVSGKPPEPANFVPSQEHSAHHQQTLSLPQFLLSFELF